LDNYPEELNGRFKFDKIPTDENEALELIAKKRGCLLKAGELDLIKASEIFLNELRSGKIGKISLESPEEYN
jgi:ribosome biogenesis GTPase A